MIEGTHMPPAFGSRSALCGERSFRTMIPMPKSCRAWSSVTYSDDERIVTVIGRSAERNFGSNHGEVIEIQDSV